MRQFKNVIYLVIIPLLFSHCSVGGSAHLSAPTELSISEGFKNPIGFYDHQPTFSWKLPQGGDFMKQGAYAIVVASSPDLLPDHADVWTSGKVSSDQSIDVEFGGEALQSRQKVYWQVRYWNAEGKPSAWSEVAYFEMGLLSNADWQAQWMKIPDPKEWEETTYGTRLFRPQYLRRAFYTDTKIKKARLYITAKGVFEASINGKTIGNDVLTPGWTPYGKRIETLTYDVTSLLQDNENVLGLTLAEGWFAGRFGPKRRWDTVTVAPSIICQLEIEDVQGNKQIIASDKQWKATQNGPLRTAGLYDGEVYDANFEMEGWNAPGFDDEAWQMVTTEAMDIAIELRPKMHPTITTKMELKPVKMQVQENDKVLYDLGQNMVGVVRINIPVKKGDIIRLRHGETLDQNGDLYTENLGSAMSVDYYTAKENGTITWQPKFTFHGFRYVEVSGFSPEVQPEKSWVTGLVQYSDFEMQGNFHSSHEKLNQLHRNIQWGLRGNFFDVPLDCPQRSERLGWTGDAQVFIPTSLFLSNTHAFWAAWLASMREEQFGNGGIPVVVPNFTGNFAQAGWSDACTIIPWELYFRTGDVRVLKDNYAMMQRWCDYHSSEATKHISHMSTVGDWLQPYSQQKDDRRGDTPNELISTAFYAYSVKLTMQSAGVLGLKEDSLRYQQLLNDISAAFEKEYFDKDGKMMADAPFLETQTGYLLALGFDILSKETAEKAAKHLVTLIREAGTHLRTGFLGTPLLANVLDKYGYTDLVYDILFQESYPSWFYSINQGATTMWERWDGYTHDKGFADRAKSFNHYAYGAIGQWMYERIAGIAPLEPGYKKILFAPVYNPILSQASGDYESRFGKITASWKNEGKEFIYNITVPSNTTAKVVLPALGNKTSSIMMNGMPVKAELINDKLMLDNIPCGNYEFILSH